ncbi:hypothetical protein KXD40_006212 [Peronospora effusa]|uniref:Uncharacterized protein n=1 Tax=Peronospora effusa TaxID=542832 RepID=A0A3M6VNL0_9STRA|nr:hypothetical protein DD238_006484 [Peronospora effusa]RQM11945.1 hypothetical protein DD237_007199 [Peronospora effusa]UIZ25792.1 hypothetical protein KXD40_006212 [Peronospora effusa]CAI5710627.1 unnamed protein product [Peronospora effusa]
MVVTKATDKYIATIKKEANLSLREIKVTMNKIADGKLPDAKAGGIVLYAKQGKIVCDNTLDTHLDQICYDLKPKGCKRRSIQVHTGAILFPTPYLGI